MSIFEQNEELLEKLEQAEALVERARIDGEASEVNRAEVAAEIKSCVVRLTENIRAAGDDIQKLGGALVVPDLIDVLRRYSRVYDIEGLDGIIEKLEKLWAAAG